MSTDESSRPGADVQRGGPGTANVAVTSGLLIDVSDNEQRPAVPDDLWSLAPRSEWLFEPMLFQPPLQPIDLPRPLLVQPDTKGGNNR